jgi:hypothetical protein
MVSRDSLKQPIEQLILATATVSLLPQTLARFAAGEIPVVIEK